MDHPLTENFRHPAALMRFGLVAVAGIALDLWTKWLAFEKLLLALARYPDGSYAVTQSRTYDFIPGWVRFEVTVNQGAVFGLGQGQRILFLVVSGGAVCFLIYLFLTSRPRQWFYQAVLGMLLAGVLGNVYDRLTYGYVRDMIHALPEWPNPLRGIFPTWIYVFPWIFNVADSLLCVGVALMLVHTVFSSSGRRSARDGRGDAQKERSVSATR